MENKSIIFSIIALVIGASGLGLGVFSVISIQMVESEQGPPGEDGEQGPPGEDGLNGINGLNGTDGIDGLNAPGYFCTSALEVQQALDSIDNKTGNIIINESISLSSKINISGGGSYVIQGVGSGITIDCNGDRSAFDITNTKSCIIKNLMINSSKITLSSRPVIYVNEIHNNPVYIEKIQIIGDSDLTGYGIHSESGNLWVRDCYITNLRCGIYQSYGDYNHIYGNILDTGSQPGIRISGSFNIITNNFIRNYDYGISIHGYNNTIKDNNLHTLQYSGITLFDCDNNIISGNFISDLGTTGISADLCNFTLISENHISNFEANGISLDDCHTNSISGNLIFYGKDDGIIITNGDYNVIQGNLIYNNSRTDSVSFAGIQIFSDSDFNVITSNGIFNCTSSGGIAYGISILGSDCDENTVLSNSALNNDDNWQDSGTDTFGNETNNNFA